MLLPLPLSPTTPSTWPALRLMLTSSRAMSRCRGERLATWLRLRWIGKSLHDVLGSQQRRVRLETDVIAMPRTDRHIRVLGRVGRGPLGPPGTRSGRTDNATGKDIRAADRQGREVDRRLSGGETERRRIEQELGSKQRSRVRVSWRIDNRISLAPLDNVAGIHDRDVVTGLTNDAEICPNTRIMAIPDSCCKPSRRDRICS